MTAGFQQISREIHGPALQTIHQYAEVTAVVGSARCLDSCRGEDSALAVTAFGVTTTPIRASNGIVFELLLDLVRHQAQIVTNAGGVWSIPFYVQSPKELAWQIDSILTGIGIESQIQGATPASRSGVYSRSLAPSIIQTLTTADYALKRFIGRIGGITRPVLLYANEMELLGSWRPSPESHPNDEAANEPVLKEMQFGFSFGVMDELEPYWFVRLLPPKDGLSQCPLPAGAFWSSSPRRQVIWPHSEVLALNDPLQGLNDFFSVCFRFGRSMPNPPTTT